MSDNKMGGVQVKTREALFKFLDAQGNRNDKEWAGIIKKITKLGAKKSKKRLRA